MSKTSRELVKKLIDELRKHANRDDCYDCKQILHAMGVSLKEE